MAAGSPFDVIVVGGGVVGCAIARRFALEGARVVLLEKAADLLDGASKGNSAILHTGFDAPPGSLEAACIAEGYREYLEIHERLGLPLIRSGALVIAWTEEQEAALPALMAQARANGVDDVEALGRAETLALEPGLSPQVRASFRVPREYLIDAWSAPLAYALQAVAHGAEVRRGCEVTGGAFDGAVWRLSTTSGEVAGRVVVNAAGLWGDVVDERLVGARDFTIRPRKGQFIVYDKPAARLAGHILLPVPTAVTKGVVVCRTAWGNLLVGPTAEEQEDRERAGLDRGTLEALEGAGGGDPAGAEGRGDHRGLCGAAAGDGVQGLPDQGACRGELRDRGRHPVDGAERGAWGGVSCGAACGGAGLGAACGGGVAAGAEHLGRGAAGLGGAGAWRDRLPLRAGDAAGGGGGAVGAAGGAEPCGAQAADAGDDGAVSGVPLPGGARADDGGQVRGAGGGGRGWLTPMW